MRGEGFEGRAVEVAAVALITMSGAILRFWNLTAGLPYSVGVDEPVIAERAIAMMRAGDFNPHFFDYPGLYIYVQLVIAGTRFMTGATDSLWRTVDQFGPEHLYAWTRAVNAALGTSTIVLVYFVGRRWGKGPALLAAALMAVSPNHVRESHFALTDVPLTFMMVLTLLLALRAHERASLLHFAMAGAAAGLTAATKYNGGLALLLPVSAALMTPGLRPSHLPPRLPAQRAGARWGRRLAGVGVAVGACMVSFLVGAPYTVLDLPAFLNSYAALAIAYRPRSFSSGALIYLGHLGYGLGWLVVSLIFIGFARALVHAARSAERAKWVLLAGFPLVYLYLVATSNLIFARYLLPILPFIFLLVAQPAVAAGRWLAGAGPEGPADSVFGRAGLPPSREASASAKASADSPKPSEGEPADSPPTLFELRRGLAEALAKARHSRGGGGQTRRIRQLILAGIWIAVLWHPTFRAVSWCIEYGRPTTRDTASAALVKLVPEQSGVVVERSVLRLPATRFRAIYVDNLIQHDTRHYVESGFAYAVASSEAFGPPYAQPDRHAPAVQAYERLFGEWRLLMTVAPTPARPGPEIRIYRLKP